MRTGFFLLAIVLAGLFSGFPVHPIHAEPFSPGQGLDQTLVSQVTGAALAFIAPRTLDAIPIPQLTIWGLRGLTTLDPKYTPELRDGTLRLLGSGKALVFRAAPADTDIAGWADVAAQFTRAAWDGSDAVRRAGTPGVIRTFFDELFNHFDPYSRYTSPAEAAADRQRRNGRVGTGITPGIARGEIVVQAVAADSPAAKLNIRPGQSILAIDGQDIAGADLAFANTLLAGTEDSIVSLTLRGPDRRPRTVDVERKAIIPATVRATRAGDLLTLRIDGFARDTGDRLARELSRGTASRPPRGIVLDLRGNRGGLLSQAVSTAETLLDGGLIARTEGRDPAAYHRFVSAGQDLGHGLPVIVIVDGRSASSAEILAAALADDGRAVVVGSSTLGKGVVQTITTLPDGGDLYVTWSRVLAPLGWPIQGLGVLPQVCTSLGEADLNSQLQSLGEGRQSMARALYRHRTARAPIPAAETLEIRSACPAAEGRDTDMDAARFLVSHPAAYEAALIHGDERP